MCIGPWLENATRRIAERLLAQAVGLAERGVVVAPQADVEAVVGLVRRAGDDVEHRHRLAVEQGDEAVEPRRLAVLERRHRRGRQVESPGAPAAGRQLQVQGELRARADARGGDEAGEQHVGRRPLRRKGEGVGARRIDRNAAPRPRLFACQHGRDATCIGGEKRGQGLRGDRRRTGDLGHRSQRWPGSERVIAPGSGRAGSPRQRGEGERAGKQAQCRVGVLSSASCLRARCVARSIR